MKYNFSHYVITDFIVRNAIYVSTLNLSHVKIAVAANCQWLTAKRRKITGVMEKIHDIKCGSNLRKQVLPRRFKEKNEAKVVTRSMT